jgi:hypothetical protein
MQAEENMDAGPASDGGPSRPPLVAPLSTDRRTYIMATPLARLLGTCLSFVAILATSSSFAAGTVKTALGAVRVPGADLEIVINVAKARKTAFHEATKQLEDELKEDMDVEALAAGEKFEAFLKSIGIEEEDLTAIVGAVSLRSIEPNAEETKVPGLLAMALAKPIKAATIREGITKAAAEEGEQVEINETVYKGVPMLSVNLDAADFAADMPPEAGKVLADLYVALPADGQAIYFGQGEQVKAAIDRMLAGSASPRSVGLKNAKALVPAGSEGYLIFDMPDAYREFMDEQAANAGGNPMAAGPMMALAGLKGAAFSSLTTDKAEIAITGDFEGPENAIQLKTMLDMGLGMAKMQLVNAAGEQLAIAKSLKTANEGNKLTISFEVTVQDIRDLVAFAKRMQGGHGGPGAAPGGAPGAAPGGVPAP